MIDALRITGGILLIVVGGMYPLWAMYRLNRRLGRPDGPTTAELAWTLAFILALPFAIALSGAALIAPVLASSSVYRAVLVSLWGISAVAGGMRGRWRW